MLLLALGKSMIEEGDRLRADSTTRRRVSLERRVELEHDRCRNAYASSVGRKISFLHNGLVLRTTYVSTIKILRLILFVVPDQRAPSENCDRHWISDSSCRCCSCLGCILRRALRLRGRVVEEHLLTLVRTFSWQLCT